MASARTLIKLLVLGNRRYANCQAYIYVADANGLRTSTLATLYADTTSSTALPNPQRLDSEGKLKQPTYHTQSIIIVIDGLAVGTHETGVIVADVQQSDISAAALSVNVATALLQQVKSFATRVRQDRAAATASASQAAASANQLIYLTKTLSRSLSGLFLRRAANFTDLGSVATARTNLGVGSLIGATRNLVVKYVTAATLDIDADEIVLKDTTGAVRVASAVDLTATMSASGANGLDTGAEASSTWYYVWVISTGTTTAALLSLSATAPTLPSGYTFKALVGVVRNDGSSNFIQFWQHDRVVSTALANIFTAKAAAGSNTYELLAGADLTAFQAAVPPIAKRVSGAIGCHAASTETSTTIAGDANGIGAQKIAHTGASLTTDGFYGVGVFNGVPLITAQQIYWKSGDTSARNRLSVNGYII